jgi:hypothetical protein
MGDIKETFAGKVMNIGTLHSITVPADVTMATVKMLFDFHHDLKLLSADKKDVDELIDDLVMSTGIILMGMLNRIYENAQTLSSKGSYPFNDLVKDAGKLYARGPRQPGTVFAIAPGIEFTLSKVIPGCKFVNNGTTVIKFGSVETAGSLKRQGVISVDPGNSVEVPSGWTTIVVINMSADTSGSFSVKVRK